MPPRPAESVVRAGPALEDAVLQNVVGEQKAGGRQRARAAASAGIAALLPAGAAPGLAQAPVSAGAAPGLAQAPGVVTGVVSDGTGGVLPGAAVVVETACGDLAAVADANGRYRVEGVSAGPATLVVRPLHHPGRGARPGGVSAGPATLVVRLVNFSTGRVDFTAPAGEGVEVDVQLAFGITADVVVTGSRTFRRLELDRPDPAAGRPAGPDLPSPTFSTTRWTATK